MHSLTHAHTHAQGKHGTYAYINGRPHFIGYAELLRNVTECIGERNTGGGRYNRVTYIVTVYSDVRVFSTFAFVLFYSFTCSTDLF